MAAPVPESVATQTGDGVTSITIAKPSGTVSGDWLFAAVVRTSAGSAGNAPTAPDGSWSVVASIQDGFSAIRLVVFRKQAGGSEPSDYTFSTTAAADLAGGILRVSGADGTEPEDATRTTTTATSGTSQTSPAITTVTADCLILRFGAADVGITSPGGAVTEQWNTSGTSAVSASVVLGTETQASAGDTGTETYTLSSGNQWCAVTCAIKPAAGGGGSKLLLRLQEEGLFVGGGRAF